jgi:hypothetical protein
VGPGRGARHLAGVTSAVLGTALLDLLPDPPRPPYEWRGALWARPPAMGGLVPAAPGALGLERVLGPGGDRVQ